MHFVRPWLAIGTLRETRDRALLDHFGIGAMLQLADHAPQPGIETLFLPLDDGAPVRSETLVRGVAFLREQHAAGRIVLVACALGLSRSVSFVAAVLKESEGLSLLDALRAIRAVHPESRPHPTLWASLCRHYDEDIPYVQTLPGRLVP